MKLSKKKKKYDYNTNSDYGQNLYSMFAILRYELLRCVYSRPQTRNLRPRYRRSTCQRSFRKHGWNFGWNLECNIIVVRSPPSLSWKILTDELLARVLILKMTNHVQKLIPKRQKSTNLRT
ncbi:hypothetical protein V1477_016892 [Vespula maculifrons]|uniref:Uncharacterized protein n=1 Tax=Vespula maculifrons TaxID=7453 RepID=A0ABD2B4H7_VESMC